MPNFENPQSPENSPEKVPVPEELKQEVRNFFDQAVDKDTRYSVIMGGKIKTGPSGEALVERALADKNTARKLIENTIDNLQATISDSPNLQETLQPKIELGQSLLGKL